MTAPQDGKNQDPKTTRDEHLWSELASTEDDKTKMSRQQRINDLMKRNKVTTQRRDHTTGNKRSQSK